MHQLVIGTDADGEDGPDNDGRYGHKGEYFSSPNIDELSDNIDDDDNVYAHSLENPTRAIFICNNLGVQMLSINLDVPHASEFSDYLNLIPTKRLAVDLKSKELIMGQQFTNKEKCIFSIKWYSMKTSMDYKVVISKLTLYIGSVGGL